jgi:sugar lactone lactonase YvrE
MNQWSYGSVLLFVFFLCFSVVTNAQSSKLNAPSTLVDELQLPFLTNGVTTTQDGRLFLNEIHLDGSAGPRVLEWRQGQAIPFPNQEWNEKASAINAASHLVLVNSLRIGPDGDLWLVDSGAPGFGAAKIPHGPKLVDVELHSNSVRRVYGLDYVTRTNSFVDDVRFNGRTAYLSDAGAGALIVLDLDSGGARRVLEGHPSVEATKPATGEGQVLYGPDGKPVFIQVDQLEVSGDGRWLFFQPASGPFSKIETKWLKPDVPESVIEQHVEHFADTPSTGGTAIDAAGNIYVSDVDRLRVLKVSRTGETSIVIEDPRLIWVDAMWIDNDGFLWMPAAQVNRLVIFHNGKSLVEFPAHVFKLYIGAQPVR